MARKVSRDEQLRWQAEDIVRQSFINTPQFKKAVRQAVTELKKIQGVAKKTLQKK